jgi:hypothetical protein
VAAGLGERDRDERRDGSGNVSVDTTTKVPAKTRTHG